MPIDVDGELGAETPGRFEVVPRALEVFTPEPSAA
jgi:diacylglycerol kinase family enzyme